VAEIRLTQPALKVLRFLLGMPAVPRSGAEIAKATHVSSGTLYPMLVRLETAGWLSSEWEEVDPREQGRPRRRFYSLTPLGQNTANRELADLQINLAIPAWTT
jgi:PadR family transcriptional regulator PadR